VAGSISSLRVIILPSLPLSDYQEISKAFLLDREFAGLFDAPGVGKTPPSILAGYERRLESGNPVLVTAPAYLLDNWEYEIGRFVPVARVAKANGSGAVARREVLEADFDFILTSYNNWSSKVSTKRPGPKAVYDLSDLDSRESYDAAQLPAKLPRAGGYQYPELSKRRWGAVIFDEGHRLRGRNSQCTRHVFELRRPSTPNAKTPIWVLTGTPIVNNPGDLYPLCCLWKRREFRSYWNFVGDWCRVTKTPWDTVVGQLRRGVEAEFQELLGEFSLRRTLADIPSLATLEQRDKEYLVELPASVRKMFDKAREEYVLEHPDLEQSEFVSGGGALYAKLRQLATIPPTVAKPKVDFVCDFLEDHFGPVVVYVWYKDSARGVAEALQKTKRPVTLITGNVPTNKRSQLVDEWKKDAQGILVATISSLKEGISLVSATDVVFLEHSELPADQEQCVARLKRRGQTELVTVHNVFAKASPDMGIRNHLKDRNLGLRRALTTWLNKGG